MPDIQLTTPTGEEGEGWGTSQRIEEYLYDPAVAATTTIANGNVVIISGGYSSAADQTNVTATNVPVVRLATTTAAFTNIGVAVNAPTGGYVPGQIVQVCTEGVAPVTCDANNTTFGHLLVAGATTAGAATDSATATAGKTIATCLATTTIASGTANVYAWVHIR
jgi:hypothetical protein